MLERHLWRDFAAVTASVAVLGIGVGSTLPLTALVLTARGLGPEVVGWMAAAAAAGGVAGTLASPSATVRFGRRRVMLGCVAVAAVSVVALQYVDALPYWAALRALFGAAMAPLFVIGEAWINSLPADAVRGRVVAIYTTSFTLCQVMGPILTGALARFPHHAFLICGGVFALGIPGIALAHDAGEGVGRPGLGASVGSKDAAASWLTIVRTAPAIVAGAALFAAFDNIVLSFLPLFALDSGLSQGRALTAVVVVFIGDATLQFVAGWLADGFGHARVHRAGGVLMCVLLPLMPLMISVPWLWEAYLYLLGGVAGSVYTLSLISSGERFSGLALLRASGLIALTWNLAGSVGTAATGVVVQHFGSRAMTAVLCFMAIGFAVAARAEPRSLQAERPPRSGR
ncbi:MAG: transporter, superfamily [Gammaproteobacteria bacterium]|nr:transporter, superfamily [Gammaproteobacteria bacterium]